MNNKKYTAQQLAEYIGCDRTTIFNYTSRGLPYELGYINENGVVNRAIKLFNVNTTLKWLYSNGSVKLKNKLKNLV